MNEHSMLTALDLLGPTPHAHGLAALFRAEARQAPTPRRAARHLVELGRLLEEELGDLTAARAAYEEAHGADPGDLSSLRCLRRLVESSGDWAGARRLLHQELELSHFEIERAALHLKLAVLAQDRFDDLFAAREHLRAASELAPDDPEVLLRLELLTPEDDAATRVELLGRRLRLTEAAGPRTQILLEMGRLTEAGLESEEDALALYREALEVTPGAREAIEGIIRLYLRAGRSGELVSALMQLVTQVTDQELRGRLMYLSAVLNLTRLDQNERAPLLLGQAAVLLSNDPAVVQELVADYESLGMWGPANALLEATATRDGGSAAALALYRAGLNAEVGLGNTTHALDYHRRAAALVRGFAPALSAIRRLSLRMGDAAGALGALDALAADAGEPTTRSALLGHAAESVEAGVSAGATADDVLHRWQAALAAAGHAPGPLGHGPALASVVRLLTARGMHAEVARTLETWLTRALETDARRTALAALADAQEIHLDDARGAIRTLQQLLECAPDDVEALRRMQRLATLVGDLPGVVSAAERELSVIDDRARKLALLMRNAELLEELGDPRRSEDALRRALALEPRFLPALMGLGRLLFQHGRWFDLAALHRHELDHLGLDEPERAGVLGRLAEVYEFRLEQADEAAACYEAILALRPKAPDALAGLERLYGARDRYADLARVLRLRAEHVDEPRDRAVLLFRLGEILHEHQHDLEAALDHYEAALELHPGLAPAVWAQERLVVAIGDRERQVMLFRGLLQQADSPAQRAMLAHKLALLLSPTEARPVYEDLMAARGEEPAALWALYREAAERGDRTEVTDRLVRLAPMVEDRRDALLLLREAAENGEESEGGVELPRRIELWEQILALDPTCGRAWEALHRLRRLDPDPGERAAFLVRLGRAAEDERVGAAARWNAGLLFDRIGGDDPLALYREAASLSSEDPVPVWLLAMAADRAGVEHDRAVLLVELARRRSSHPAAANELTTAGLYFADVQGEPARALTCFHEAVARDPHADEAARRAERLLESEGRLAELAEFLARRLQRLDATDDVVPVARRLAALQAGPLGDLSGARETTALLVARLPADFELRWQFAELCLATGDADGAVVAFGEALDRAPDDLARARCHTRIGQIRARNHLDLPAAVESLRTAVGLLDPAGEALEELAAVQLLTGEHASARLAYERLERLVNEPERVRAAQAGQVRALIAGGDFPGARERLNRFRAADRRDAMFESLAARLEALDPTEPADILVTDPAAAPLPVLVAPPPIPVLGPPPQRPTPPPFEPVAVGDFDLAHAPTGPVPLIAERAAPPPRRAEPPPMEAAPPLARTELSIEALRFGSSGESAIADDGTPNAHDVTAEAPVAAVAVSAPPPLPTEGGPVGTGDIRQTVPYGLPAMPLSAPPPPPPPPPPSPSSPPPLVRQPASGIHDTELGMPVARGIVGKIEPVQTEVDPILAVRGARTRIEADPLDVNAWRELVRATQQRGHLAAARWYADALAWLEGDVVPAQPLPPPGPLPDGLRRPLLPPTVPAAVLMLLRQVGPFVSPPFCADAGRHGVTAQDLVGDQDPLAMMGRRLAEILGVDSWLMLRNPSRPYTVAVEAGDPSAVVLGSAVLDGAPDTSRAFLVARCLVPLGEGTLLARKLTDREFGAFLAALLGLVGAEFPVRARDRATYDRMRAQIDPALPAARRSASLTDLARASAQSLQSLPAAALRAGLETYASRLALAVTDGCGGALEMLRRQDFDDRPRSVLSRADLVQFIADSDTARDLLVFASSPACEAIRSWLAGER